MSFVQHHAEGTEIIGRSGLAWCPRPSLPSLSFFLLHHLTSGIVKVYKYVYIYWFPHLQTHHLPLFVQQQWVPNNSATKSEEMNIKGRRFSTCPFHNKRQKPSGPAVLRRQYQGEFLEKAHARLCSLRTIQTKGSREQEAGTHMAFVVLTS